MQLTLFYVVTITFIAKSETLLSQSQGQFYNILYTCVAYWERDYHIMQLTCSYQGGGGESDIFFAKTYFNVLDDRKNKDFALQLNFFYVVTGYKKYITVLPPPTHQIRTWMLPYEWLIFGNGYSDIANILCIFWTKTCSTVSK